MPNSEEIQGIVSTFTYSQGHIDSALGNKAEVAPYLSYQAIISQSSTSAPSASVKLNELGVTLNWGRTIIKKWKN